MDQLDRLSVDDADIRSVVFGARNFIWILPFRGKTDPVVHSSRALVEGADVDLHLYGAVVDDAAVLVDETGMVVHWIFLSC